LDRRTKEKYKIKIDGSEKISLKKNRSPSYTFKTVTGIGGKVGTRSAGLLKERTSPQRAKLLVAIDNKKREGLSRSRGRASKKRARNAQIRPTGPIPLFQQRPDYVGGELLL